MNTLYFRYYTQNLFVTRLIINKINKVQWVDFNLESVLVSLHSLKTMGLGPFWASAPLFLRNGELLGHSPILKILIRLKLNTHYCRDFFIPHINFEFHSLRVNKRQYLLLLFYSILHCILFLFFYQDYVITE